MTQQPGQQQREALVARRGRPSRASVHQRLAGLVDELKQRFGGLPSPVEADGIWTEIWYSEAHNSTAIEGNTLVLRQVERLLRDGRAVGEKRLSEYLEVQGYAEAARWVYDQAIAPGAWSPDALLTLTEVRQVHALAMTPVWQVAPHPDAHDAEAPGNWRQHDIHPFPGGMTPPPHPEVQARMTDWVADVDAIPSDSAPIAEVVAKRHAAFERIHPFLDGNGRAGRLLTNLVLVRLGYPPAIIHKRDRPTYLDALGRADTGDPGPLGEIIARAITENLTRFIIPAVAGPARLVPLESLAAPDLGVVALRAAAERGRLRAVRGDDGRWRSSKQWLDNYRASRYATLRGRRKPIAEA
jgi:cell filamentation protein, protein adenylyltransferase